MSSDVRKNDDGTFVVLVAVEVSAPTMQEAQLRLAQFSMPRVGDPIISWWIAEDERYDGSDNDSAVFVPKGEQRAWAERVDAFDSDAPVVNAYPGGLAVINPHATGVEHREAGAAMFGVVTEESPDEDEADCYDYVLGHWPNGEEWVELARWPVEWDIAADAREARP